MNTLEQMVEACDRLNICFSCDKLDHDSGLCVECTCDVFNKTRLMGSECPLGKWHSKDWES
jgi:hypothetical protein